MRGVKEEAKGSCLFNGGIIYKKKTVGQAGLRRKSKKMFLDLILFVIFIICPIAVRRYAFFSNLIYF